MHFQGLLPQFLEHLFVVLSFGVLFDFSLLTITMHFYHFCVHY